MATPTKQPPAHVPPESLDIVETPTSPTSGLARSRFEFETDKRNEGTKILMVEWDDPAPEQGARPGTGVPSESKNGHTESQWKISWEGKGDVLPVWDAETETGNDIHRVYFLLPPGAPIPALVDITHVRGSGATENGRSSILRTKPMPAIFTAELTNQQDAGRRGVLHTVWAKGRLAELKTEIANEMRANGEGVGLEMAMREQQWIVDHFGLAPDPNLPQPTRLHIPQSSAGPASPRSPVSGRLGEKLRGLKLATSPAELAAASQAAKNAQAPPKQPLITALSPPNTSISVATGSSGDGGVASLDAIVGTAVAPTDRAPAIGAGGCGGEDAIEEDLFALPMSPRSPEMKRSPFSNL
ncbi:hypothetical protein B0J18DRAFT_257304 [Chaetomium sp. MPI-SDFR-AT-0129]|uniref:Uncharacterized protein n=1 Tax=Dichotomopilus funicola TaxID=1934379 RepID=A0AAN6V4D0_9PEZI|nr:hypothetical protein B0J18DRAFT_257304 [Chaetomium sp. MPI-SDFR-AT-0129]KAK4143296.1 hypothetical protein C8A04DRAFT_29114 [Dichotomopilus funicola]